MSDKKFNSHRQEYLYQLLDRLRTDCEYYLGNGNHYPNVLWAGNEQGQIAKMKEIWNELKEKPEWLTWEDIIEYAKKMGVEELPSTQDNTAKKEIQDMLDRNYEKEKKIGLGEGYNVSTKEYNKFCKDYNIDPNDYDDVLFTLDELEGEFGDKNGKLQRIREYVINKVNDGLKVLDQTEKEQTLEKPFNDFVLVYQLQESKGYRFMSYEYAKDKINLDDYELVAKVPLYKEYNDVNEALEYVFSYGNSNADFYRNNPKARSISVSDILQYKENNYYVDSFGFILIGKGDKLIEANIHSGSENSNIDLEKEKEDIQKQLNDVEEIETMKKELDDKMDDLFEESKEIKTEDQYESERRRGVPPLDRIAEMEYYDNEKWYKEHIKDYLDITDFVNKNIAEISSEYNLKDTKAEEVCKKVYRLAVGLDKKSNYRNNNETMVNYFNNITNRLDSYKFNDLDIKLTNTFLNVINNEEHFTIEIVTTHKASDEDIDKLFNIIEEDILPEYMETFYNVKDFKVILFDDSGKTSEIEKIFNNKNLSNKEIKEESQVSNYTLEEIETMKKELDDKMDDLFEENKEIKDIDSKDLTVLDLYNSLLQGSSEYDTDMFQINNVPDTIVVGYEITEEGIKKFKSVLKQSIKDMKIDDYDNVLYITIDGNSKDINEFVQAVIGNISDKEFDKYFIWPTDNEVKKKTETLKEVKDQMSYNEFLEELDLAKEGKSNKIKIYEMKKEIKEESKKIDLNKKLTPEEIRNVKLQDLDKDVQDYIKEIDTLENIQKHLDKLGNYYSKFKYSDNDEDFQKEPIISLNDYLKAYKKEFKKGSK